MDYGTAIVVSSRGDLLAAAAVTDRCQSITIAGLGHAERIANDDDSDLAVLRLYGAHNLSPAALADDADTAADLALIGVADPLAQAGAGAVSHAPARITTHGIDPVSYTHLTT